MSFPVARLIPVAVLMGIIFFLSHQPGDTFMTFDFRWSDKIAHFIIYGCLAFSALLAFPSGFRQSRYTVVAGLVFVFCLLYGASDEFHQSFIPGRYPSAADLIADGLGALTICILFWTQSERRLRNRK